MALPNPREREYGSLTLVWLAVHALSLLWLSDGRHYTGEIGEARNLLAYGFWARKGAFMRNAMSVGILPNPADFNYVNHPYPYVWFITLVYWLSGRPGVFALIALAGLAGCLMTYRFLKEFFPLQVAWFATALLIAAHGTIEFATNTEAIAQSAILWPLAGLAIIELRRFAGSRRQIIGWLLGLAVFVSGQISWFALTTVPALMVLCLPPDLPLREAMRRPWRVPGWLPLMVGSLATVAVFITQLWAYSPNLGSSLKFVGYQANSGGGFLASRVGQLPVLVLRMLLAGPALWLGAVFGVTQIKRNRGNQATVQRLAAASLLYLVCFGLVEMAIPKLFFGNQHAFRLPLWPCTILTAIALTSLPSRWLRWLLAAVAVPGLLFCYAKIHEYRASTASTALGNWLALNTGPDEIIFSNLSYLKPPIQPWDGECFENIKEVSNRYMASGVTNDLSMAEGAVPFRGLLKSVVFLEEMSQPMDPALRARLELEAPFVVTVNLPVPPEGLILFKTARASLWRMLGKRAPQTFSTGPKGAASANTFALRLYRLSSTQVQAINQMSAVER